MSLEVTGKLIEVYETVQVSEKFKKREFVIEMVEEINGNNYTNFGKFQAVQAKCDMLDRYNVGDTVKVSFNIKGNSYTDKKDGSTKYMTNLDVWKLESANAASHSTANATVKVNSYAAPAPEYTKDDLPF
jgi:hypothetical protein